MSILSKQKNYPAIAAAIAFCVSCIFLFVVPRNLANTALAEGSISFIVRIVPAMRQLNDQLPKESEYIALTGAAIWALTPVYAVLVAMMPILDLSFISLARTAAEKLNSGDKKVIGSYCFLSFLVVLLGYGTFFTLWAGHHHTLRGFWLDMVNPFWLTQLATWTTIGLTEYLVCYLILCIGLVLKLKFLGE